MLEKVGERIEVEVDFLEKRVVPRKFFWQNRVWEIKKIGLIHPSWQGRAKIYHFSVSDGVNFFRLSFNTDTLEWRLEEVYAG